MQSGRGTKSVWEGMKLVQLVHHQYYKDGLEPCPVKRCSVVTIQVLYTKKAYTNVLDNEVNTNE